VNLDSAIRSSGIRVAVRESLVPLVTGRGRYRTREEWRKIRIWELPYIATKNLVKFDDRTGEPVYETRVYTNQGQPVALALAKRRDDDDWVPVDRVDPITLMGNLLDREEIVARQRRITTRKRELGVPEGQEWTCTWIHDLIDDGEDERDLMDRIFGGPPAAIKPPIPPV